MLFVLVLFTDASACQSVASRQVPFGRAVALEELITVHDSIVLDSVRGLTLVLPTATVTPTGGFLVADVRQQQISRFTREGRLINYFGGDGDGPSEFRHLATALPLSSGEIFVLDRSGTAMIFDSLGERKRTTFTGLAPVYDAALIDDSLIAITARKNTQAQSQLLHIWNYRREKLVRSFWEIPGHSPRLDEVYAMIGSADVTVRGDTLAAIFALSDTLYLFDVNGNVLRTGQIASRYFRKVPGDPPKNGEDFLVWRSSFSRYSQILNGPGNTYFVQYFDLRGFELDWRLLQVASDGTPINEVRDSRRLVAYLPDSHSLIFVHPDPDQLNTWTVARLRTSR